MAENKKMSVSEAISSRHSTRDFLSTDVSLELINKILNEARYAPSSGNLQPWKIYIIHGETKDKLALIVKDKFMKGQFDDPPFEIYPGGDIQGARLANMKEKFPKYYQRQADLVKLIYELQGIGRDDIKGRMKHGVKNFDFFGAPIGLLFSIDKDLGCGQYPDLGIIIGYIMLLCEQYGLASCTQVSWSLWNTTLRKVFDIQDNEIIFCGMSIGYKNNDAKVNTARTERMQLEEFVITPRITAVQDI